MSGGDATPATVGTASTALAGLPLRRDAEDGFPVAGAALLAVLLVVAIGLAWSGRRRKPARDGGPASWLAALRATRGATRRGAAIDLHDIVQVEAGLRLIVVEWDGGRLLIGASAGNAPVVLDRLAGRTRAGSDVAPSREAP